MLKARGTRRDMETFEPGLEELTLSLLYGVRRSFAVWAGFD